MTAVFVIWLLSSGIGLGLLLLIALRPPSDGLVGDALRRSGVATVPAVLPALEYVVRLVREFSSATYYVRWPLFLGCLCGLFFIVASFMDAPFSRLAMKWSLVRMIHVLSWGSTAILSIAMLLDV
ncbi:MAG: hypothetical protein KIS78_16335 [Labilithrix sp.]|nr:hypothetical protein [Labilithrix sp.]